MQEKYPQCLSRNFHLHISAESDQYAFFDCSAYDREWLKRIISADSVPIVNSPSSSSSSPKWRAWTAAISTSPNGIASPPDDMPVGFLLAQIRNQGKKHRTQRSAVPGSKRRKCNDSADYYVELFWLLVDPAHRRRGLARQLCACLFQLCADGGEWAHASEFRLHVLAENTGAKRLYEEMGFTCTVLKRNYPEPSFQSWRMVKFNHGRRGAEANGM